MKPTYHFDKTYEWNYQNGPDFQGDFPDVIHEEAKYSFLGYTLNSKIGISAGMLLNSEWIRVYSQLGFDILTYKTVRSAERPCYPLPNWVFVKTDTSLNGDPDETVTAQLQPHENIEQLTSSVCFGMPSAAPDVWREDVAKAKESLRTGQILIVSVVGTPGSDPNLDALARDYALCAKWAVEAGADIIEANVSCPNVCTLEGSIDHDKESTITICEAIQHEIPEETPLLLKIGIRDDLESYKNFLQWTQPYADGLVLVNCISKHVVNENGDPIFGAGHKKAGVLGWGIHDACLKHTKMILEARHQLESEQSIVAVGGVMSEKEGIDYFNEGADAVLMGGAPVFDPELAMKIKKKIWGE